MKTWTATIIAVLAASLFAAGAAMAQHQHDDHGHGQDSKPAPKQGEHGSVVTVTGEVIDMVCYIDHNATGEKHTECARECIESGLPVGIKGGDGKTYLLVGEHKPSNKELAKFAAKTITVRGKFVTRDGFNMLENIEIVQKP